MPKVRWSARRCLIEALGANYWDYDERRLEALIRLFCPTVYEEIAFGPQQMKTFI